MERTPALLQPRASPSNAGSHRDGPNSISGLLSTLIPVFVVSVLVLLAFLLLSRRLQRVYTPRSFLPNLNKDERSPKQSSGFLGWTKEYQNLTDEFALAHSSMDNYLFLRLFKILAGLSLAGCIITWPILFPVNATGGGGEGGLNILSFSNVNNVNRYYAHTFVAWIFLGLVMVVITRETRHYINVRQAYLLSPFMKSRMSSRTVLMVDVPEQYRSEDAIRGLFSHVRSVWFGSEILDLQDKVDDRDKASTKLEGGETKMISDHAKSRAKKARKMKKKDEESGSQSEDQNPPAFIYAKDRPTHRLPVLKFLPIGRKVDTIDHSRNELHRLVPEILRQQTEISHGKARKVGTCFIEFETVGAAQAAFQEYANHNPLKMSAREVGMTPDQVLWDNIALPAWNIKLKSMVFTAIVAVLCLFWTAPVAFIGFITNIQALTSALPFLSFINSIPDVVLGVVTGLLPVLLLSVLMKLVPIFCSMFAKTFEPTLGAVQLKVQSWYFAFQVIQVFLITTFSSGAAAVVQKIINDPTTAPQLLAKNLPKASNFYISYFILFGLLTMALQFLNVVPLLFVMVLGRLLDKTPRKMYNRYVSLTGLGWGSLYPKFTNLGVIAISYSCIAPLVLGFATLCFILLYLAFRYNILFVLGTNVDTKGRCYAKALEQLTVGIYLAEVCLIGLFAINTGSSTNSVGPLVLMIVFLIGTVIWHVQMHAKLHKLTITLPEEEEQCGKDKEDEAEDRQQRVQPPTGLAGHIKTYFLPWKYANPTIVSRTILEPHLSQPVRPYTQQEREEAYLRPCIVSPAPTIWIPKDAYGLAEIEAAQTRDVLRNKEVQISCEGAWVDEKGKVCWDQDHLEKVPIWEEECVY